MIMNIEYEAKEKLPRHQKLPFASEKDSKEFLREVILLLIREFDNRRKRFAYTENSLIFYHGKKWNYLRKEGL